MLSQLNMSSCWKVLLRVFSLGADSIRSVGKALRLDLAKPPSGCMSTIFRLPEKCLSIRHHQYGLRYCFHVSLQVPRRERHRSLRVTAQWLDNEVKAERCVEIYSRMPSSDMLQLMVAQQFQQQAQMALGGQQQLPMLGNAPANPVLVMICDSLSSDHAIRDLYRLFRYLVIEWLHGRIFLPG